MTVKILSPLWGHEHVPLTGFLERVRAAGYDRDDLILSIAVDEGKRMGEAMLKGFDTRASFEAGLRLQWKNRCDYMLANPLVSIFFEQLRSSSYQVKFLESFKAIFHGPVRQFIENAVRNGEIHIVGYF